ncbi:MAG: ABC transporter permease subunit [Porphyromonas sp.]|nr:ABC transporter permease subunit [Porphyromonas sp.]
MKKTKTLRKLLFRTLLGILLINLLWGLAAVTLRGAAIESPVKVYQALPQLLNSDMVKHLSASLSRILIGLPIALLLGILIAWLMYRYRMVGKVMSAFTYLAYPIPKLALLPIVMLIAGLGDGGKITMIVLIIIFQVIVNIRDSLLNIPKESFLISTSLGANQWQVFRHILLPATLPDTLSTLRVAIGTAISVLFVTETYGTEHGMGYFITDAWMRFDYITMYGAIVILSIVGFLLFLITDLIEMLLCQWKETTL